MFTEDGYVEDIGWCEEAGCLCSSPNCNECPVLARAVREDYDDDDYYEEEEYDDEN